MNVPHVECTTWNFECGCGKRISVKVEMGTDPERTRETAADIAKAEHGWVSIHPSDLIRCSAACWNTYHGQIFNDRKTFYPQWWESSPNGRAKHGGDAPPCHCKPKFRKVFQREERGRGRVVSLLDAHHHDERCWWQF